MSGVNEVPPNMVAEERNVVLLAAVTGAIPAMCMLLASFALLKLKVTKKLEAIFENLAGGLILGATAEELFPLLATARDLIPALGLGAGFIIGCCVLYGVDVTMARLVEREKAAAKAAEPPVWDTSTLSTPQGAALSKQMAEVTASMDAIEERLKTLSVEDLPPERENALQEEIDSEMHKVQYTLDHARRLADGNPEFVDKHASAVAKAELGALLEVVHRLRAAAAALPGTVTKANATAAAAASGDGASGGDGASSGVGACTPGATVTESVAVMVRDAEALHHATESGFDRWRSRFDVVKLPAGAKLPWSLIVPVCVDGCLDGLLIGLSCVASTSAGIIMGVANVVEMSFVGISLAISVAQCTGSSLTARRLAVTAPPVILLSGALIGAAAGEYARSIPALFAGVIAFGMIGLLFLVLKELLIKAHEAQGEDERWYISIMMFVGIGGVMILDRLLPKGPE